MRRPQPPASLAVSLTLALALAPARAQEEPPPPVAVATIVPEGYPALTATLEVKVGGTFTTDPSPWTWDYVTVRPGTANSPKETRTGTYTCAATGTITDVERVVAGDGSVFHRLGIDWSFVEDDDWTLEYDFSTTGWTQQQIASWLSLARGESVPGPHSKHEEETEHWGGLHVAVGSTFTLSKTRIPHLAWDSVTETGPGPRDVVAVAEKAGARPRVRVTWRPPEDGVPEGYHVERRRVGGGAAKAGQRAGESDAFEVVASLAAGAEAWVDRNVQPDQTYEYRVAAAAHTLRRSVADAAYPVGRIPLSAVDLWRGDWEVDETGSQLYLTRDDDGAAPWAVLSEGNDSPIPRVVPVVRFHAPEVSARRRSVRGALLVVDPLHDEFAAPAGTRGTLSLNQGPARARSSSGGYRSASARIKLGYAETLLLRQSWGQLETSVGATVGAAKSLVAPGKRVVVAFQCTAVGPSPLQPERVVVEVVIENGTLVAARDSEFWRPDGEDVFEGHARHRFALLGLGNDAAGRPEVASLDLIAQADDAPGRQMRLTYRFIDAEVPTIHAQAVTYLHAERVVEVAIYDKDGPAKR